MAEENKRNWSLTKFLQDFALDDACAAYQGRLLYAHVTRERDGTSGVELPGGVGVELRPFHLRLHELFYQEHDHTEGAGETETVRWRIPAYAAVEHENLRVARGVVGVVEEPGHRFEGYWVVCHTRMTVRRDTASGINFTDNLALYHVQLGTERPSPPTGEPPALEFPGFKQPVLWPWWHFPDPRVYWGRAWIAASEPDYRRFEAEALPEEGAALRRWD